MNKLWTSSEASDLELRGRWESQRGKRSARYFNASFPKVFIAYSVESKYSVNAFGRFIKWEHADTDDSTKGWKAFDWLCHAVSPRT